MVSVTSIALVLLLTVVSATLDGKQKYQKDRETCSKLLRVPADTFQQFQRHEYPENHETFCFVRCVGVLQGHYDDEHGLLVDNMFESVNLGKSKEEYTELMNGCQAEVGEDVSCYCHKAFIPLMCFRKHFLEWKKTAVTGEQAA